MTLAAILFAIAAVGGVTMAGMRFKGKDYPPMAFALLHGALAAAGLIALLLVVLGPAAPSLATVAVIGFVIAALGGFFLFSFHLRKQALPIPVVTIHGLVAVISFVILLVAIFGRS